MKKCDMIGKRSERTAARQEIREGKAEAFPEKSAAGRQKWKD